VNRWVSVEHLRVGDVQVLDDVPVRLYTHVEHFPKSERTHVIWRGLNGYPDGDNTWSHISGVEIADNIIREEEL
jgi:hypothetical protein